MTTIVTACTKSREEYVKNLHRSLQIHAPHVRLLIVAVDKDVWIPFNDAWTVHVYDDGEFNLSHARNRGFAVAAHDDDKLIWLDADCVVGKHTIPLYEKALEVAPDSIAVGPAEWLNLTPAEVKDHLHEIDLLYKSQEPLRRFPPYGEMQQFEEDEFWLLYGLSFAMTADVWRKCEERFGGFCEEFIGWGPEDADFSLTAEKHGIAKTFIGGALAYHQWHPREWPPISKLETVVRNSNLFFERHGFSRVEILHGLQDLGLVKIHDRGYIEILKSGDDLPEWVRQASVVKEGAVS